MGLNKGTQKIKRGGTDGPVAILGFDERGAVNFNAHGRMHAEIGRIRVGLVAPPRGVPLKNHCQTSGDDPIAAAVNVTLVPGLTVCDSGCVVMLGGVPAGGLVTVNVADAEAEPKGFETCTV